MRLFASLLAFTALVSAGNAAEIIPAGTVACMNRNAAADYAAFLAGSPDFAQDLLNRASCYKLKDPAEAVRRSAEKGFVQYQLLSGHKVWVPMAPAGVSAAK